MARRRTACPRSCSSDEEAKPRHRRTRADRWRGLIRQIDIGLVGAADVGLPTGRGQDPGSRQRQRRGHIQRTDHLRVNMPPHRPWPIARRSSHMKAYRETVDWMYSNDPAALKTYADFVGISLEMAKRTRDEFFPKASVDPDKVIGLDTIVQDAVALKFTAAPLTKEQLAELIQIPPR
jgi:hypothetical protein